MMKRHFLLIASTCLLLPLLAQEEKPVFTLSKHAAAVRSLAWSPDGSLLASGAEDNTAILWNTQSGEAMYTLSGGHVRPVLALTFTADGKKLITAGDKTLVIWNTDGTKDKILGTTVVDIWSVDISGDGKYLAAGSYEKKIHVWDLESGSHLAPLSGHEKSVLAVAFGPNKGQMISGSLDETIKIWNVEKGECLKTLKGHNGNIYSIAAAPSADFFVSASKDLNLLLWTSAKDQYIHSYSGHQQAVMSVSLGMDGKWMLSGALDNQAILWETFSGKKIYSYIGFEKGVNAVAFSKDNTRLAIATGEGKIYVYNVNPELFVDAWFGEDVEKEISSSSLFDAKRKEESRTDYALRQEKAEKLRKEIYAKYYSLYLEKLKSQSLP